MTDILLHALGGALLALLGIAAGAPGLAFLFAWLLGYERERVQLMNQDIARHASHFAFWEWSSHKLREWLAWPFGAILTVAIWRLV
jgi:hypothetical protein